MASHLYFVMLPGVPTSFGGSNHKWCEQTTQNSSESEVEKDVQSQRSRGFFKLPNNAGMIQ